MAKARHVRLTIALRLPCWVNEADLDRLERDIGLAARKTFDVAAPQSIVVDIRSLEVL